MGQDGEKPIKDVVLSDEDQHIDGISADDHDDSGEADPDSEIEALGQALINAILDHAPPEVVQKLLNEDEPPLWYQDEDGWSALHAAASVEDAELVKDLLQRGAPWNSGERALSYCLHTHCTR
jgi:protein arginine N-methyltransferase 2